MSKDGYNVFITENSWLSTDYGKKFQEYLLANIDVCGIIDSDYKYFSDAEVNTIITILKNKANRNPLPVSFIHCHGNMKNFPVNLYEKYSVDGVAMKKFSSDDILFDSYKWSVPFNADEEILDENGNIDFAKAKLLTFAGKQYFSNDEVVGTRGIGFKAF